MNRQTLKKLALEGCFVGPDEDEKQFLKRIDKTKKEGTVPKNWDKEVKELKNIFGFSLPLPSFFYSNKNLRFWQGAATWIYTDKTGVKTSSVQLRSGFKKTGRFLFYRQEEVLAHESIHQMRAAFDEKRFEEIFAYLTAKKAYRRFLGPLFKTPMEAGLFLTLLLTCTMIPQFPFFYDLPFINWIFFLPLFSLSFLSFRLVHDQRTLQKALKNISKIFGYSSSPLAIALHLTDKEIKLFSKKNLKAIRNYIKKQSSNLRWKQIISIDKSITS